MKRLVYIVFGFTFCFFSCGTSKTVESDGWKFIADKWVNFGVDRDMIHVGNIGDEYSKLVVRVTDAPLRMYDMKVFFDNGGVQDVAIKSIIRQGGQTRIIDLDGGKRRLSKIEFWYETKGRGKGRSRVAVWGK
ncbi:MAG: hypothetical protein IPM92_14330 [Saprospiraceae bacterium]|nr:hypothetical protein [Saprospiraceae bacterium]